MKRFVLTLVTLLWCAAPTAAQVVAPNFVLFTNGPCRVTAGTAAPEGVKTGNPCDQYLQIAGGTTGKLWVKRTGTSNTGWLEVSGAAGADQDVQINSSGAFGADTGLFTYNSSTHTLGVNNIASQLATALTIASTAAGSGNADGPTITITGANAISSSTGGQVGGNIALVGGNGAATGGGQVGTGGSISLTGGVGALSGTGGAINLTGGLGTASAVGGPINITSGASISSGANSGPVTIKSGTAASTTDSGNVLNTTGTPNVNSSRSGTITILPAAAPDQSGNAHALASIGTVTIKGGRGQNSTHGGGNNGGNGAAASLLGGDGGNALSNGGVAGIGADVNVTGGVGGNNVGAGGVGGAGGNLVLTGGTGGTGTSSNGADGVIKFLSSVMFGASSSKGDLLVSNGSSVWEKLTVGSNGQMLVADSSETLGLKWTTAGDASTNTSSSVDSEVALFSGTAGKTIKRATGTGIAHLASGVLSASAVVLTSEVSGTLPATNGGTGVASYTKGDILVATDSTTLVKLPVGSDGQALIADSGQTEGLKWATAGGGGGAPIGDFSSNTATSVDSEVVVFSGTGGKTGKRATGTGPAHLTSGVLSASDILFSELPQIAGVSLLGVTGSSTADLAAITGTAAGQVPQMISATSFGFSLLNVTQTIVAASDDSDSDSTLHNDPELAIAVVANAVYVVEGSLQFTSGASSTPDVKVSWTIPTSATLTESILGFNSTATVGSELLFGAENAASSPAAFTRGVLNGGTAPLFIKGVLVTGANAGTLQFQFAQGTTTGGTPTVRKAASYISIRRIQ